MHECWITTHDPHGSDDEWFIYVQRATRVGGLPKPGDRVLFYETGNKGPDGQVGRKALVCAAEVVGGIRKRMPPKGKWLHEIPCSSPHVARRVLKTLAMLAALGLPKTTPIHTWRGLKPIEPEQYDALGKMMGI